MITSPDISQLSAQLQTAGQARALLSKATQLSIQALDEMGSGNTSIFDGPAIDGAREGITHTQSYVDQVAGELPDDDNASLDDTTRAKVRLAAQETVDNLALVENTINVNTGWVDTFVSAFHTVIGTVGEAAGNIVSPLTRPLADALWPIVGVAVVLVLVVLVLKHAVTT